MFRGEPAARVWRPAAKRDRVWPVEGYKGSEEGRYKESKAAVYMVSGPAAAGRGLTEPNRYSGGRQRLF